MSVSSPTQVQSLPSDNLSAEQVSIIIPCYNAKSWIDQSIESALRQTWPNIEVIVIDDGSTDGSQEAIAAFGDRIRFEFGPNRGGCAARNRGLALARGRWIQFLDADDIMLPDCVERKMQAVAEPNIIPCCNIEYLPFQSLKGEDAGPSYWLLPEHDLDSILSYGAPQTSAPLHRKQQLDVIGGFREGLRQSQDRDLHLRLAIAFDCVFRSHGAVGVQIRAHPASVSRSAGWKMTIAIAEVLLHGADLLEQEGKLTDERRVAIAQRATRLARKAALEGAIDQASAITTRARALSSRWHQAAYKTRFGSLLVRLIGFSAYEKWLAFTRRYTAHSKGKLTA